MILENLELNKGEKKQGFVKITNTELSFPVTIICGEKDGKTLLITSGIHCNEYVGIESAIELAQEIDPKQVKGKVIIVHPVNISGFLSNIYNSRVPEDGKNLNRVFPGNKEGSLSEKIASFLVEEFQLKADYYIDLHGGAVQEELTPYVYYVTVTKPEIKEIARNMAQHVNVKYMVGSKVGGQGSYNYAGTLGIPSILIERGCSGLWLKEEVLAYKKDIRNIMRYLEILDDGEQTIRYNARNIDTVFANEALSDGCWYPEKKVGQEIKKGEILGVIKDYFGNVIEKIYAKGDGVILYQTCSLSIHKGEEAVVYGEIK